MLARGDYRFRFRRESRIFTNEKSAILLCRPRGSAPPGLNLSHNQLTDLTGLANSPGLIQSMSIDLRDNPISCTEQAENIQKLRQRVQTVAIDCPAN